jgi:hypothetical protein
MKDLKKEIRSFSPAVAGRETPLGGEENTSFPFSVRRARFLAGTFEEKFYPDFQVRQPPSAKAPWSA